MFEHHSQPVISHSHFIRRLLSHAKIGLALILLSLGCGMSGYHFLEGIPWVDALLDASMILGGMGPVSTLHTTAGKVFASLYALYSGLLLIGLSGLMLSSVFHRILHTFHAKR